MPLRGPIWTSTGQRTHQAGWGLGKQVEWGRGWPRNLGEGLNGQVSHGWQAAKGRVLHSGEQDSWPDAIFVASVSQWPRASFPFFHPHGISVASLKRGLLLPWPFPFFGFLPLVCGNQCFQFLWRNFCEEYFVGSSKWLWNFLIPPSWA